MYYRSPTLTSPLLLSDQISDRYTEIVKYYKIIPLIRTLNNLTTIVLQESYSHKSPPPIRPDFRCTEIVNTAKLSPPLKRGQPSYKATLLQLTHGGEWRVSERDQPWTTDNGVHYTSMYSIHSGEYQSVISHGLQMMVCIRH